MVKNKEKSTEIRGFLCFLFSNHLTYEKNNGKIMKNTTKKVLKTVGVVGATTIASYYLIGNVFYFFTAS
mgnify:CR=1 FL=1